MTSIAALGRQRQEGFCEFEARLVYVESQDSQGNILRPCLQNRKLAVALCFPAVGGPEQLPQLPAVVILVIRTLDLQLKSVLSPLSSCVTGLGHSSERKQTQMFKD